MAVAAEVLERDVVRENATKIVWTLAWPAVALNSLAVVNNLLDTGFVGRLAPAAITAQGASLVVVFLLFQVAFALGTAATALVSRAFGADDHNEVRLATKECLCISLLLGIGLTAMCALLGVVVPHIMIPANNPEAMHLMTTYVVIYGLSLPAQHIIQVLAGSLRGVGDTRSPMWFSGLQIVLHMTFNFLLIFPTRKVLGVTVPGAGIGLAGAGCAFALSSWLAMGVFMFVLRFVPDASEALAAVRGGFTIESIMFMPGLGLSMAAAALVGQSLGMGKPERAEKLGWTAGHYAALVVFCLSVPIFIFAPAIANLLVPSDPQIAREMATMMRFMCTTEFLFGYSMVMSGALQGAGDTVSPMWITIICLWGLRVPLAFLLALPVGFGASGAWISMALTQGIAGLMGMWFFKRGGWKTVKV